MAVGVESMFFIHNRYESGTAASRIIASDIGVKYSAVCLSSFGVSVDGFALFVKNEQLQIMKVNIFKAVRHVPGMEQVVHNALGPEPEPEDEQAVGKIPSRDIKRIAISQYFCNLLNKFGHCEINQLPQVGQWEKFLKRLGVKFVLPAGVSFEAITRPAQKRSIAEQNTILMELRKTPRTIYLQQVHHNTSNDDSDDHYNNKAEATNLLGGDDHDHTAAITGAYATDAAPSTLPSGGATSTRRTHSAVQIPDTTPGDADELFFHQDLDLTRSSDGRVNTRSKSGSSTSGSDEDRPRARKRLSGGAGKSISGPKEITTNTVSNKTVPGQTAHKAHAFVSFDELNRRRSLGKDLTTTSGVQAA